MTFQFSSRRLVHAGLCLTLAAVLTILLTPASALAAKKLRWNFSKGDVYRLEMKQQMLQKMTNAGQTFEIPVTQSITMTWKVSDVDTTGIAAMSQVIDRIVMSTKPPIGGEVKYDSASKEEPKGQAVMFARMLQPLVGAEFTQRMSARGQVTDVVVPQKVTEALNANPLLRQTMSPEQLQNMMVQNSPVFPEAAMVKGHQWKAETENKLAAGVMNMATTYAYQGEVRRKGRTFDAISIDLELEFKKTPGATIEITDQDNRGTIYFDGRNGHLSASEIKQDMTLKITAGGNQIDQKLVTTTTLKVSKKTGQ